MEIPNKLKIIQELSRGQFGEVFLCENSYLSNRKEAVKFISTKSKDEKEKIKELKENLFESSVLEYLKKSPYIVNIYDAEILNSGFRINMEFLENGSIQELLKKQDFLNIKQIIKISECVLHALEHAHNKHILHLDIKPGNILIKNENIYKLSDFGLANVKSEDGTSSFKKIYTAHYPPERLAGSLTEATEQSDIYMFGVTLYRLLNGESYFANQWHDKRIKNTLKDSIIAGKFPNRGKYLPHVNSKIKKIVNKCLDIDLNKRYQNVREIRNDFGKIKMEYCWIPKNITAELQHWECLCNENLFLELIAEKKDSYWDMSLYKFGPSKKTRIVKHCGTKLDNKSFYKKANKIFNEFL
jgi:eukaryotic-like serine/threonine-protein kinase